jgi:hypothetical protein
MTKPNQPRIDKINARMEEMHNTLSRCDWDDVVGYVLISYGYDDEMDQLRAELAGLESKEVTDGSLDHLIYDERSPRP